MTSSISNMNIGSEGIRIEYQGTAVGIDYTNEQVVVESKEDGNYIPKATFEENKDTIEKFTSEIIRGLEEERESSSERGEFYRIETLGNLPESEKSEAVYTGNAETHLGIHEEDGFPELAYRVWNEYSTKAKTTPPKAD